MNFFLQNNCHALYWIDQSEFGNSAAAAYRLGSPIYSLQYLLPIYYHFCLNFLHWEWKYFSFLLPVYVNLLHKIISCLILKYHSLLTVGFGPSYSYYVSNFPIEKLRKQLTMHKYSLRFSHNYPSTLQEEYFHWLLIGNTFTNRQ